jgi:alditol oxidase
MTKRTFLKTATILTAGATLPQLFSSCNEKAIPRTNWAGNLTYSTDNLFSPQTVAELQENIK